ncbi:MAG: putative zinc-binding peptidase [Chitinophagaceae bacterium]
MKLFKCTRCGQLIYFENTRCEQCEAPLGFDAASLELKTLSLEETGLFKIDGTKTKNRYRYCFNHQYNVCNWLVNAKSESTFCVACDLNRTIPDLSVPEHLEEWQKIETAKHRLVYSLLRMKLPLISKKENEEIGLAFDFIANSSQEDADKVLTGHHNGLITINIAEADDVERETSRKLMKEVYRTVLGHFRHEIAHYYWDRLISDTYRLENFRSLFGDDRINYADALKSHYEQGAPADWNNNFISAYASTHPWEDWAETWAHYMHIVDTLETAYSFGLTVDPRGIRTAASLRAEIKTDPYRVNDFETIKQLWLPLTFAMNSLNRSMGLNDLYPFIIPPPVFEKMKFIHRVILQQGSQLLKS